MNTTRLEIAVRECESRPPGFYPETEDYPTPEEMHEHDEMCRVWEAAGGPDRHYFRVSLLIGLAPCFASLDPEGLQRTCVESPFFHKDDPKGRAHAEAATRDMLGHCVSAKLLTLPLP